jgi:hypothetical protein
MPAVQFQAILPEAVRSASNVHFEMHFAKILHMRHASFTRVFNKQTNVCAQASAM